MGDKDLGLKEDVPQTQARYCIIECSGQKIPNNYKALIFGKWLKSLRAGNDLFKLNDAESYYFNYHVYLEKLFTRTSLKFRFAVIEEDHDTVLGWACLEPGKVHYVWVQPEQRGQGVAKSLCSEPFKTVTHLTNTGLKILATLQGVKFDAFG